MRIGGKQGKQVMLVIFFVWLWDVTDKFPAVQLLLEGLPEV